MHLLTKQEMRQREIDNIKKKFSEYFDISDMDDSNLVAANSLLENTTGPKVVFIVKHMSLLSELKKVIDEAMGIYTTLINPIIRFIRKNEKQTLLEIVKQESADNWVFLVLGTEETNQLLQQADEHHLDFYFRNDVNGYMYCEHTCSSPIEVIPLSLNATKAEKFINDVEALAGEVHFNARKKLDTLELTTSIFNIGIAGLNDLYHQKETIAFDSDWGDYVVIVDGDGDLFIGMIELCDYNINGKIARVYKIVGDKDFEEVLYLKDGGAELIGGTIKTIGKWI